jgi:hypothetical protein
MNGLIPQPVPLGDPQGVGAPPDHDTGSASSLFLCTLFLAAALIAGMAFFVSSVMGIENRWSRDNDTLAEMQSLMTEVVQALYGDPSPGVNGPEDPVWAWDGIRNGAYTVSIKPLSDRLNPNFVRKNVFEKTTLGTFFVPGKTASDLQQFREDQGLSLLDRTYRSFFQDQAWEDYFSEYGWANINLIDEFAARQLVLAITGSEQKAETFRDRIQSLLMDQRLVQRGSLDAVLGTMYEELFPLINAEPLMNVNFMAPQLLEELAAYPGYGVSSPGAKYREILDRRSRAGLNREQVLGILGIDETNTLACYLGTITWFWGIYIEGNNRSYRAVVCRLPSEAAGQSRPVEFNIIEQRYQ